MSSKDILNFACVDRYIRECLMGGDRCEECVKDGLMCFKRKHWNETYCINNCITIQQSIMVGHKKKLVDIACYYPKSKDCISIPWNKGEYLVYGMCRKYVRRGKFFELGMYLFCEKCESK